MNAVTDEKRAELSAHRRRLLNKLANNSENKVIADMAKDLLSGRRTPKEVMADEAVAEEFSKGVEKFGHWYEKLSDKEKDEAADTGAQQLTDEFAEEQSEAEPPVRPRPAGRRRPRPAEDDDVDFSEETLLQRRDRD